MYQDMMDTIGFVSAYDPEVAEAMNLELGRQRRTISTCRQGVSGGEALPRRADSR